MRILSAVPAKRDFFLAANSNGNRTRCISTWSHVRFPLTFTILQIDSHFAILVRARVQFIQIAEIPDSRLENSDCKGQVSLADIRCDDHNSPHG